MTTEIRFDDDVQAAEELFIWDKEKNGNKIIKGITTTKLRNVLSIAQELHNSVLLSSGIELSAEQFRNLRRMKVRLIYECGRDGGMKNFVDKARLINRLDEVGKDKKKYIDYCHYLEALVAYHLFYGGKEK